MKLGVIRGGVGRRMAGNAGCIDNFTMQADPAGVRMTGRFRTTNDFKVRSELRGVGLNWDRVAKVTFQADSLSIGSKVFAVMAAETTG